MTVAGYSGTPLPRKLGIRERSRVAVLGAPEGFADTLAPLPAGAALESIGAGPCDVIVVFATERNGLARDLPSALRALGRAGGLWIAWPKRAAGTRTDLSEAAVREIGLAAGLVDNKVCAVDAVWSGLRFVVRVADRDAWPRE